MIQRRKDPAFESAAFDVRLGHVLQQLVPVLHHMAVTVDNCNSVPSHNQSPLACSSDSLYREFPAVINNSQVRNARPSLSSREHNTLDCNTITAQARD